MSKQQTTWKMTGMHCPHCESAVVRAVATLPGLSSPKADYRRSTLTALWDRDRLTETRLRAALQAAGYDLRPRGQGWRSALQLMLVLGAAAAMYAMSSRSQVTARLSAFPVARAGMSLGALFLVGVMTSLHCVAMCGGINLSQSSQAAQSSGGVARANLHYNAGRIISYTLTGCAVGALGTAISFSDGAKAGVQLLAAAFMLMMALNLLGGFDFLHRFTPHLPKGLGRLVARLGKGKSSLLIGLLNGLMPCGPLQAMQLCALSAGSWWMGGLSMLAFALGTTPLMLGFGLIGGRLNSRFRAPMRVISAVLVLVMSVGMLSSGLSLLGIQPGASTPDVPPGQAVLASDGLTQTVRTELDWGTYQPLTVKAGVPVIWTLHAEPDKLTGCNNELIIPALKLRVPLSAGDNVIEFTPEEPGVIAFTCWMGMLRSSITVVE